MLRCVSNKVKIFIKLDIKKWSRCTKINYNYDQCDRDMLYNKSLAILVIIIILQPTCKHKINYILSYT